MADLWATVAEVLFPLSEGAAPPLLARALGISVLLNVILCLGVWLLWSRS